MAPGSPLRSHLLPWLALAIFILPGPATAQDRPDSFPETKLESFPEIIRFEDEQLRLGGPPRLLSLISEASERPGSEWFALRVAATHLHRELSRPEVTAQRFEEIRHELDQLEGMRDRLRAGDQVDLSFLGQQHDARADLDPLGPGVTPSIIGRVTDAVTGEPIEGLAVNASFGTHSIFRTALTDANGEYSLENLPLRDYYLLTGSSEPTSAPYIDEVFDDAPCLGGLCDPELEGQPVPLLADEPSPVVDFALEKGGQIVGEVRDAATLELLPFAYVKVFKADGTPLDFGLASTSGSYETPALPAGDYYVRASGPAGYLSKVYPNKLCGPSPCTLTDGQLITVTADSIVTASFTLPRGATISGRVTSEETGDPVASQVRVYNEDNAYITGANANSEGHYTISRLLPGRYYARVLVGIEWFGELWDDLPDNPFNPSSGTPIDVELGDEATGIDFALRRGATLTGSLTLAEDDSPFAWTALNVTDGSGGRTARTDGEGVLTFGPLAPGTAYVWTDLRLPGVLDEAWDDVHCPFGSAPPNCGTPIAVVGTETVTGIHIALDAASALRGRVVSSTTGEPVAGAEVSTVAGHRTETAADGSYAFSLGAGFYLLRVRHPDYLAQASGGVPCPLFDCPGDVGEAIWVPEAGVAEGLDFALHPGGVVTGQVTSAGTGQPLAGVIVWLYDASGLGVASGVTDAGGHYRSTPVPLGNAYFLNTPIVPNGYLRELWQNRRGLFHLPDSPEPRILEGSQVPLPPDASAGFAVQVDLDLDATAVAPELTVTLDLSLGGQGSVTSDDGWIDCGFLCSSLYPTGAVVTLQATPSPGSDFRGWSGEADCLDGQVSLSEDIECTARFASSELVFTDGFESGNTEAWIETVTFD